MRIYSVPYTAGPWRWCKNWEMFPLPLWVYKEEMVLLLGFPLPLLFLKMLMLFLKDSVLKLKRVWFWTKLMSWPSSVWHLLAAWSELQLWLWGVCGGGGGIWRVEDQSYQPCPWVFCGIHLSGLSSCLWWGPRDALEESHFLPELRTSNFPSGTQNDPVTHEQRYFFGKLVSISSLHTSQHSIFATCQAKYAVVYPDFPFLSGTKQARACAQGFVNQGATWQFYGLCIVLHQLTFLLFCLWSLEFSFSALPKVLDMLNGLLGTEFTHFCTYFLSSDCGESCVGRWES